MTDGGSITAEMRAHVSHEAPSAHSKRAIQQLRRDFDIVRLILYH